MHQPTWVTNLGQYKHCRATSLDDTSICGDDVDSLLARYVEFRRHRRRRALLVRYDPEFLVVIFAPDPGGNMTSEASAAIPQKPMLVSFNCHPQLHTQSAQVICALNLSKQYQILSQGGSYAKFYRVTRRPQQPAEQCLEALKSFRPQLPASFLAPKIVE